MTKREPTQQDLVLLAQALADFGVQYALIGGTAMAVHGFSRATKDIDLLLPVDADNNARLLQALTTAAGQRQCPARPASRMDGQRSLHRIGGGDIC